MVYPSELHNRLRSVPCIRLSRSPIKILSVRLLHARRLAGGGFKLFWELFWEHRSPEKFLNCQPELNQGESFRGAQYLTSMTM